MTNMNPAHITYETGYCNCRSKPVNTLVYKYIPLGEIIKTEKGIIRDRGIARRDYYNRINPDVRVALKETMRIEWVIYIREMRQAARTQSLLQGLRTYQQELQKAS